MSKTKQIKGWYAKAQKSPNDAHVLFNQHPCLIIPITDIDALVEQVAQAIMDDERAENCCFTKLDVSKASGYDMYLSRARAALRSIGVPLKNK